MARHVTTCGLCGVEILWIRMQDGDVHPVDAAPLQDMFVITGDDRTGHVGGPTAPWRLHQSHVVTCRRKPRHADIVTASKGLPK